MTTTRRVAVSRSLAGVGAGANTLVFASSNVTSSVLSVHGTQPTSVEDSPNGGSGGNADGDGIGGSDSAFTGIAGIAFKSDTSEMPGGSGSDISERVVITFTAGGCDPRARVASTGSGGDVPRGTRTGGGSSADMRGAIIVTGNISEGNGGGGGGAGAGAGAGAGSCTCICITGHDGCGAGNCCCTGARLRASSCVPCTMNVIAAANIGSAARITTSGCTAPTFARCVLGAFARKLRSCR